MALRVRKIDENGNVKFGRGSRNYLSGSPATAQRVKSEFGLNLGEWFLNTDYGFPWFQPEGSAVRPILGGRRDDAYAAAKVKSHTLGINGITAIKAFAMSVDSDVRHADISENVTDEDGATFPVVVSSP